MTDKDYIKLLHLREEDGFLKPNHGCARAMIINRDDLRGVFFDVYFTNNFANGSFMSINSFLRDMSIYANEFYETLEDKGLEVNNKLLCVEQDFPGIYMHAGGTSFRMSPIVVGDLQNRYDSYEARTMVYGRLLERRFDILPRLKPLGFP